MKSGRASMLKLVRRNLPSRMDGSKAFDAAAILLLLGLAAIVLLTFEQYAISNDEEVQHRYGELILSYYTSGFADQSALNFKNLYLYGGLFDVSAVLLGRVLPFDLIDIRHVLCGLIGVAGIGATWATARLIAGPRAAFIAAIALATCGAWYGAMFNHTKDIPFAAAMMGATYFLLLIGRALPRPRLLHVLGFALTLGAALGIRVGGLMLIGYAGIVVLAHTPFRRAAETARFWLRSALVLLPALVVAYLIMIAAWPWAAQARSIRCARSTISRNSTTRSVRCCSVTSIRWPTCRAGMSRPISSSAHRPDSDRRRARACVRGRAGPCRRGQRQSPAGGDGARRVHGGLPGPLPRDRARAGLHGLAALPVRRAAAGRSRRHRASTALTSARGAARGLCARRDALRSRS